jgi:membrane-bound serine protease (ClpP class)
MDPWLIWALVLFVVGLLIVAAEVVVVSGGLLALAAFSCLLGSLWCAYQLSVWTAVVLACVEGVCVPVVIALMFKVLPRTSIGRQLILSPPTESGDNAASQAVRGAVKPTVTPFDDLLGKEGKVVAPLRPSGTAEFDGRRVSVITNGEIIEPGSRVRVVLVEGSRVVVESVQGT